MASADEMLDSARVRPGELAAGDSDGARAALRMHLGGSRDRLAQGARARA